jgi:hypothetical protein
MRSRGDGFAATSRFEVLRCIGSGGMGTVYEALDKERNTRVALKTLHAMTGESLLRFKKEFRDFQNLSHPNLVSVGELFSDGEDWFFSMELIDGVSFTQYVQRAGHSDVDDETSDDLPIARHFDEARLRGAAVQLAEGLIALHEASKVHCDIKPSNVLVTNDGRVVLLDFGLAADIDGREHKERVEVVGTIHYMAPEQAAGRQPGPPADWYAFGVVLFEALTGTTPFTGSSMEVLMNKQHKRPPPARTINPAVPEDLDALCTDLLRFNPSERPTGPQFLRRLGVRADKRPSSVSALSLGSASASALFVGRERELHELRTSFEQSRTGAQLVALHGESGVGKSALARRFIQFITHHDASVVVLRGTCYERESVPYKAVDGIIDALSLYLQRLPKAESAAVLPRKAALLAQVFPVLKRVEAIAEAPRTGEEAIEPREQRSRLFEALRELFQRLSDRRPVVIAIDDMQWADADSLALLSEVLREPDSPALMLVATVRTPGAADADLPPLAAMRALRVERLSPAEGRELALALITQSGVPAGVKAHQVAQEAGGHPMFIHELVRHASTAGALSQASLQLEEVLWSRISHLDAVALQVLQLVCLADGKLAHQTAARAAGLDLGAFAQQVALLRVARLVRTTGVRATDTVAPYHTRIRAAVLAQLPHDRSSLHRRLAIAFEMSGMPDPEALATHWREAGDHAKAAHYARLAGDKAAKALAFDRAARFYEQCLTLSEAPASREVRVKLAEALANAGRGGEAGSQYLVAADAAGAAESIELRRRAAEQLLRSGHIDEGLAAIQSVCEPVGLKLPESAKGALASLLFRRALVRARGLSFRERDESHLTVSELQKIDTCWSVSAGLALVDTIRGADFQARQLLLALRAGEPYRVVRALAMEIAYAAVGGEKTRKRTDKLLKTAEALAQRVGRSHAIGLTRWAAGTAAFLQGRWQEGYALNSEAEAILRDRCTGVTWELDTARFMALWSAFYRGDVRELQRRVPALRLESEARGDLYAVTNLRTAMTPFLALVDDDPTRSHAEAEDAITRWSRQGFFLQQCNAMFGHVQASLYEGAVDAARERIEAAWPELERSMLLQVQQIRVRAVHFRACARVAVGDLAAARDDVDRLHREGVRWARALALLVRASLEPQESAAAIATLRTATSELDACELGLYADAARHRLAVAERDAESVRAADAALRERGVRNPDRMTAMLAPTRATTA